MDDLVGGPDEGPVRSALLPITAQLRRDGSLTVGGVGVVGLAERYGTPLFVYDEDHLRARCREAVAAWGDGVAYATKAFLCLAMARLAHEEGMWLDVSTGGELHVALSAKVPASHLVLHGNNKSDDELARALAAGVGRIVIDSFDEIARLERLTSSPGEARRQAVMIRVTPGVEAHTHDFVRTGQEDSKFGFGLASGAAAEAVARVRAVPGLDLVGVHAHIGSQVFRVDSFARGGGGAGRVLRPSRPARAVCRRGARRPLCRRGARAVHRPVGADRAPRQSRCRDSRRHPHHRRARTLASWPGPR